MNSKEKLDLKKLLSEMNATDNTEDIKRLKHSTMIRDDIRKLESLKLQHPDKSFDELSILGQSECPFLFGGYTDIFNKVLKGELDLVIMSRLLTVLKLIEDGNVDQHEGSVMVGKILKELYIDSAIKQGENLDKQNESSQNVKQEPKVNISWKDYSKGKRI
jgi:hypothetical protein